MNPKQNPVTYVLKQSMQFKMNFKTHSNKQLLIFSVLIFTVCTTAYVRNIWRKPKKITEEECTLLPLTTPARYCSSSYHRFEFLIKKNNFTIYRVAATLNSVPRLTRRPRCRLSERKTSAEMKEQLIFTNYASLRPYLILNLLLQKTYKVFHLSIINFLVLRN